MPELAEVLCELLSSRGPVSFDAVAEFYHIALEVELVFLEPGNVELLARCTTLQLAVDVLVVIADDPTLC